MSQHDHDAEPPTAGEPQDPAQFEADQAAVQAWLATAADAEALTMPQDVVERLDAQLAQAARTPSATSLGTVLPMTLPGGSRLVRRRGRLMRLADSRAVKGLVAAGLIAVIGLGGYTALHRTNLSQDSTTASGASSGKAAQQPPASVAEAAGHVRQSGTAYTKANITAQVDQQLSAVAGASDSGSGSGSGGTAQPLTGEDQTTLQTPTGLQSCLTALGATSVQPLLVDLATFDGKPAAVLVLPATGGGREIWVVARTCAPGHDGTLLYVRTG